MVSTKKVLANLGLAILSICIVLIIAELVLRVTPFKHVLSFSRSHVPQHYYRTDPVTGYDITPNFPKTDVLLDDGVKYTIWSNGMGCFDNPYVGEKEYVLLVGDSFTHAFAPFEDKWGTRMESFLGKRVLKCGVSGYGTKQASLKAQKTCTLVRQTPGLIVVGYTMNDFMDDYLFPQYSVIDGYFYISKRLVNEKTGETSTKVRSKPPRSIRIWLKQHSILFNLVETTLKRVSPAGEERIVKTEALEGLCSPDFECKYPWLKKAWESHFENLKSLNRLPGGGEAKVLFVVIPVKEQVYPFLSNEKGSTLDRKYAIVLENMKKKGLLHLDLLPLFRQFADQTPRKRLDQKKDFYWSVDGHWNVRGNHLAGLLVSEHILKNGLIDTPDRQTRLAEVGKELEVFAQKGR